MCIEVAKAIGRGGIIAKYSYCNDCGSQHVKTIAGMQCIVCNVLNKMLGEKQVYKPGNAFASSPKSYQDTLDETAHLLETIKSQAILLFRYSLMKSLSRLNMLSLCSERLLAT